jgi:hypothetical protein
VPVNTILGPVQTADEVLQEQQTSDQTQAQQQAGQTAQLPDQAAAQAGTAAAPAPAKEADPLARAIELIEKQQKIIETQDKRFNDQRSWFDKRMNDLQQSLRPKTPENPEDWGNTIGDPNKAREFVLNTVKEAAPESNTLTETEVRESRAERLVRDFERTAFKDMAPEKAKAYSQYMFSILSEQVEHISEITPKMLQGAFNHTDKIFSAAMAGANGGGNTGGQPKAGTENTSSPPQAESKPDSNGSKRPAPIHISGTGMSGAVVPKAETVDDLKQLIRRVDWSKTE